MPYEDMSYLRATVQCSFHYGLDTTWDLPSGAFSVVPRAIGMLILRVAKSPVKYLQAFLAIIPFGSAPIRAQKYCFQHIDVGE